MGRGAPSLELICPGEALLTEERETFIVILPAPFGRQTWTPPRGGEGAHSAPSLFARSA